MGIVSRLAAAFRPAAAVVETRSDGWGAIPSFTLGSSAANVVDVRQAENLATVQACVQAIASGLASLPARIYRTTDAGRVEQPNHPAARLLTRPNMSQTWPDLIEWLMGQVLLYGNGLLAITVDGGGNATALQPVPWGNVNAVLLPSGRLAYDVTAGGWAGGWVVGTQRLLADEVVHLRDRSDNGLTGRSRLSRSPGVIAAAAGLAEFSQSVWDNAAAPSGLLAFTPAATEVGRLRQAEHFKSRNVGSHNAGRILFSEGSTTFTPFSVSPADAETLASRAFSVTELCRLFGVPPPLVQDYSNNTFTNAATAELWFASRTLLPWATKLEAVFSAALFSDPSYSLDIDLSGLLRGDYATLMATNTAAVAAGILTRDEAREAAGYGPLGSDAAPPVAAPPATPPAPATPATTA